MGTRWVKEKVPPGMLIEGRNIRFKANSITIRPGLSMALHIGAGSGGGIEADCPDPVAGTGERTYSLTVS
jgi:hypothetical protein